MVYLFAPLHDVIFDVGHSIAHIAVKEHVHSTHHHSKKVHHHDTPKQVTPDHDHGILSFVSSLLEGNSQKKQQQKTIQDLDYDKHLTTDSFSQITTSISIETVTHNWGYHRTYEDNHPVILEPPPDSELL